MASPPAANVCCSACGRVLDHAGQPDGVSPSTRTRELWSLGESEEGENAFSDRGLDTETEAKPRTLPRTAHCLNKPSSVPAGRSSHDSASYSCRESSFDCLPSSERGPHKADHEQSPMRAASINSGGPSSAPGGAIHRRRRPNVPAADNTVHIGQRRRSSSDSKGGVNTHALRGSRSPFMGLNRSRSGSSLTRKASDWIVTALRRLGIISSLYWLRGAGRLRTAASAGGPVEGNLTRPGSGGGCTSSSIPATEPQLEVDKPLDKKLETFIVRSLWTLILVFTFAVILAAGHVYSAGLVLALVASMYREIIAVKQKREEARLPDFYLLKWYWFVITIMGFGLPCVLRMPWQGTAETSFELDGGGPSPHQSGHAWFGGGRTLRRLSERLLLLHSLLTYTAAFVGLVWFILSLRKGAMRYQFSQLGVMLVALVFIVGQSLMQIANIYSGLVWFVLPTSLVIVNDVSAYICGMLFGRTRLIRLSPKKTVEGFVGASLITLVWAVLAAKELQQFQVFVCPPPAIDFRPFAMWQDLKCQVPDVFVPRCYDDEIEASLGLKAGLLRTGLGSEPLVCNEDTVSGSFRELPGPDWETPLPTVSGEQERAEEGDGLESSSEARDAHYTSKGSDNRVADTRRQKRKEKKFASAGIEFIQPSEVVSRQGEQYPAEDENEELTRLQQEQQAMTAVVGADNVYSPAGFSEESSSLSSPCVSSCRFFFSPFQFHSIVLGVFAAFFAPFGGFFASGFKRAARIKDFGELIPGHGGVTDRFDCQILTGMFTHLYYTSFVRNSDEMAKPLQGAQSSEIEGLAFRNRVDGRGPYYRFARSVATGQGGGQRSLTLEAERGMGSKPGRVVGADFDASKEESLPFSRSAVQGHGAGRGSSSQGEDMLSSLVAEMTDEDELERIRREITQRLEKVREEKRRRELNP